MSYSALDSLDMGTRVLETKDCIKGWGGRWCFVHSQVLWHLS